MIRQNKKIRIVGYKNSAHTMWAVFLNISNLVWSENVCLGN